MTDTKKIKKLSEINQKKYGEALELFIASTDIDLTNPNPTEKTSVENPTIAGKLSKLTTSILEKYISEGDISKEELALGSLDLFKELEDKYIDSEPAKNVVNVILMVIMKKFMSGGLG